MILCNHVGAGRRAGVTRCTARGRCARYAGCASEEPRNQHDERQSPNRAHSQVSLSEQAVHAGLSVPLSATHRPRSETAYLGERVCEPCGIEPATLGLGESATGAPPAGSTPRTALTARAFAQTGQPGCSHLREHSRTRAEISIFPKPREAKAGAVFCCAPRSVALLQGIEEVGRAGIEPAFLRRLPQPAAPRPGLARLRARCGGSGR
jgi:hypothetical protein